ncbi:hypothetical protein [Streptomyces sp. NPDC091278]|uniref:hypothetical protein n=1 Tax=Streptomyces sp. NPDC091278 TaxID=3155301 RepID=UPI00344F6EC2
MDGQDPVDAEEGPVDEAQSRHRPDYPPRTPPPQHRPVVPERPSPPSTPVPDNPSRPPKPPTKSLIPPGTGFSRPITAPARMGVRNRRAVNWALPADRWAAKKAVDRVTATVRGWGYALPADATVDTAVRLLVGAVVADDGKRVSVHLADQAGMVLVVVLSHTAAEPGGQLLTELAAVPGMASCGTEESPEGRRVFALLETRPPRTRAAA